MSTTEKLEKAGPLVFVNYRARDTASAAAMLERRLVERLGPGSAFLDYESIPLGREFDDVLLDNVRSAAVLLVVIGDRWLTGDDGRSPLRDPRDWVRREILEAFAHDVPVAPVLIEPAPPLDPARLPPELQRLAALQHFEIRARRHRRDLDVLVDMLIDQLPRLRDRPVRRLTPWQAFVAALHTDRARSPATVTLDLNAAGELDGLTLRRDRPADTDHLLRSDPRLVDDLAHAAGLRADDAAVEAAEDWIDHQLRSGRRRLDRGRIEAAAIELGIRTGPARAIVSIATLKPDPLARDADHSLDWVDRFDGDTAYARRRPLAPATWADLHADIDAIPHHLPARHTDVLITGSLRQATAFTVGAALRMVTGVDVAITQRGQLWTSRADHSGPVTPTVAEHHIGRGDDLAIAIAVATDLTDDVLAHVHGTRLPVGRLLTLTPPGGIRDDAVPDPATAVGLALGIRDTARRAGRTHPAVHLYLAGPTGLALLLGHRWNRVRPTHVYEDVQSADVYERAFTIAA